MNEAAYFILQSYIKKIVFILVLCFLLCFIQMNKSKFQFHGGCQYNIKLSSLTDMIHHYVLQLKLSIINSNSKYTEYNTFKHPYQCKCSF